MTTEHELRVQMVARSLAKRIPTGNARRKVARQVVRGGQGTIHVDPITGQVLTDADIVELKADTYLTAMGLDLSKIPEPGRPKAARQLFQVRSVFETMPDIRAQLMAELKSAEDPAKALAQMSRSTRS